MSRRHDKYPRFHAAKRLTPGQLASGHHKCGARGCTEPAVGWVMIEVSYMRGEDETVFCCLRHSNGARKRTREWCQQFPPESWR